MQTLTPLELYDFARLIARMAQQEFVKPNSADMVLARDIEVKYLTLSAELLALTVEGLRSRALELRRSASGGAQPLPEKPTVPEGATNKTDGSFVNVRDMSAEEFNNKFSVGSQFWYYPILGQAEAEPVTTRSEAWEVGSGAVIVKVIGRAGGISIAHFGAAVPNSAPRG